MFNCHFNKNGWALCGCAASYMTTEVDKTTCKECKKLLQIYEPMTVKDLIEHLQSMDVGHDQLVAIGNGHEYLHLYEKDIQYDGVRFTDGTFDDDVLLIKTCQKIDGKTTPLKLVQNDGETYTVYFMGAECSIYIDDSEEDNVEIRWDDDCLGMKSERRPNLEQAVLFVLDKLI